LCVEASAESIVTAAAAAAAESSAAAQLLANAMSPTTTSLSVASANTAGVVRQITPSTPIVLSAEALTSLLMMNNSASSSPAAGTVELSAQQILQYVTEQAGVPAVTLSMDSEQTARVPAGPTLEPAPMSNDLEVGAQEMVLDEASASSQKHQHPLHLN